MNTIAIITPNKDTFTNPMLAFLIDKLIENNFRIIFFGAEQIFIPAKYWNKIIFRDMPFNFYKFDFRKGLIIKTLKQYYEIIKLCRFKYKVKALLCVDPMGLIVGSRFKNVLNAKLIYISFEIFFKDECIRLNKKQFLKNLESDLSSKADLVIIQDREREKLLRQENNFNGITKFIHIPVSPKQISLNSNIHSIYKELGIPDDKKIIIYSGTLLEWGGINKIISLLPEKWNSEYWLVLHSPYLLPESHHLQKKLKELEKKNYPVTLHYKPISDFEEYAKFLIQCFAGLATYFPTGDSIYAGKNIEAIGLASGKFATYMMLGIPTVTTNNTIFNELNQKYNFGEVICDIEELPSALDKIKSEREKKSTSCKVLYKEELNPEKKMQILLDSIKEMYN